MGVTVDGLFSGIDTTALIESLVEAYSAPKESYEAQIDKLEERKEKLSELISLMGEMEDALQAIEDESDLQTFSASYEDNDAFTAEVDGDGVAGVYAVEVSSLASSEMEICQGFADCQSDDVVATGTMTVTYAGVTSEVKVESTTSLADLAYEINKIDGLTSYVMDTGDASDPYRLVIQGDDTGAANTIEVDTSGLTGPGTVPTFTEQASAADAQLTINGVSVRSTSNTVNDAIPGLTLKLTDTTSSPIDVTIDMDGEGVEQKIQTFVDAYNAVVGFIADNSEYDADEGTRGVFVGEGSVQRVALGLRSMLTSAFDGVGGSYNALSVIGVQTDGAGTLSIDSDKLQDALAENAADVIDLFTGQGGFVEGMLSRLDVYIDPLEGSLEVRMDAIDERIEDLEDQVERYEGRIDNYEERLRKQFTEMESLLGSMQSTSSYLSAYLSSLV